VTIKIKKSIRVPFSPRSPLTPATAGRILPVDIAEVEGFKLSEVNREYRRVSFPCRGPKGSWEGRKPSKNYEKIQHRQTGNLEKRKEFPPLAQCSADAGNQRTAGWKESV